MRIVNRKHLPWFLFTVAATLFSGWLYLGNFHPQRLPTELRLPGALLQTPSQHRSVGGTPIGLVFGSIALAIFVFAVLLGMRKRIVRWRISKVQRWLRAHIWLTLLTIPLVLFHCGFRMGGPMTTLLIGLYLIVMVSGIYGLILQHYLPNAMMQRLGTEPVYEQIPFLRTQLVNSAEAMWVSFKANGRGKPDAAIAPAATAVMSKPAGSPSNADSEAALADLLERQVIPYLSLRRGERHRFNNSRFSEQTFRYARLRVTQEYGPRVEEIESWCDERRMLDRQIRLQHWLHGWLFIHAPISFLLLLLTFWHAYVTLFHY